MIYFLLGVWLIGSTWGIKKVFEYLDGSPYDLEENISMWVVSIFISFAVQLLLVTAAVIGITLWTKAFYPALAVLAGMLFSVGCYYTYRLAKKTLVRGKE
jgi:hypothetical protein